MHVTGDERRAGMDLLSLFFHQFARYSFNFGKFRWFARPTKHLKQEFQHGEVTVGMMSYGSVAKEKYDQPQAILGESRYPLSP